MAGLCVHTTAFFTKSFSQSFEDIPREILEALEATGTNKLSVFVVCDAAFPYLETYEEYLNMDIPYVVFNEFTSNPLYDDCCQLCRKSNLYFSDYSGTCNEL